MIDGDSNLVPSCVNGRPLAGSRYQQNNEYINDILNDLVALDLMQNGNRLSHDVKHKTVFVCQYPLSSFQVWALHLARARMYE